MNPNRVKVWYRYRCRRCLREQLRGSSAKNCSLAAHFFVHGCGFKIGETCGGTLMRLSREAQTRLALAIQGE